VIYRAFFSPIFALKTLLTLFPYKHMIMKNLRPPISYAALYRCVIFQKKEKTRRRVKSTRARVIYVLYIFFSVNISSNE
jgi:hypothetical protein